MKRFAILLLALCFCIALVSCGEKPTSDYDIDVKTPEQTSAPAPSAATDATPSPTPQAGWAVAPRKDIEIVSSLADESQASMHPVDNRANLAFFTQNGQTGVIDLQGKVVVPTSENVHWCDVCGITNQNEEKIFDSKGEVIGSGGHGGSGNYAVINSATGEVYFDSIVELIKATSDYVQTSDPYIARVVEFLAGDETSYIMEDGSFVKLGETQGYRLIDADGVPLNSAVYQEVKPYSEGIFPVKFGGAWGFVDAYTGDELLPCKYQEALPFKSGIAAVKTETGWGYVSLAGTEKTVMTFAGAITANDGKAWAKTADGWGVIILADWKS